jgi:hypothetical protein
VFEASRVLKPGGRFAVSDVVVRGEVPQAIRRSVEIWIGCVAGALEESEYRRKLAEAGLEAIELEPTRVYRAEDAREFPLHEGEAIDAGVIEGKVHQRVHTGAQATGGLSRWSSSTAGGEEGQSLGDGERASSWRLARKARGVHSKETVTKEPLRFGRKSVRPELRA